MFNLKSLKSLLSDVHHNIKSSVGRPGTANLVMLACILLPTASFASADRVETENYQPNYQVSVIAPVATQDFEDVVMEEPEIDPSDELAQQIIEYASKHVGRPYRYGSGGPKAFDCSGFTSYIFKNFGIDLTRSSRSQYTEGEKIANEDIKPGDLLFFKGRTSGSVGHVGIAVDADENGKVRFIHAATSKGVIYSTLDEAYYSKRYIGARRVL